MDSIIYKTCIWTFVFQTSLVEVAVLQVKVNATGATKKITKYESKTNGIPKLQLKIWFSNNFK